ncbi:MAG: aldolase [Sphingopyxis macrogoltabida]|uniref:Aldolase n=1 Tax=Sphingopyxis macrogoltabida TaxID=33050 RepID=A0A2W5KWT0_SPHMC|nr:MAG: aldolase [Sphingopyxis macrogoltabida]
MTIDELYESPVVQAARHDLAVALRAADHFGYSEGICNHFSLMLTDGSDRFLINPRGIHWSMMTADDIVLVDAHAQRLAGRHDVEPTAAFIHAAIHRGTGHQCVLHTHMPYATALTLTKDGVPDTTLSQNAMRFHRRIAYDSTYGGLALDATEGERIAAAIDGRDIAFLANHGVIVCGEKVSYAFDDLYYLEIACRLEMIAAASGRPLAPVSDNLAMHVRRQFEDERAQSDLFFASLKQRIGEYRPA